MKKRRKLTASRKQRHLPVLWFTALFLAKPTVELKSIILLVQYAIHMHEKQAWMHKHLHGHQRMNANRQRVVSTNTPS